MKLSPYLTFNGNCREAMTFYKACIGGELEVMGFGDMPNSQVKDKDKVMHARLHQGDFLLMASDNDPSAPPVTFGQHVHLSLDCPSREVMHKVFKALADKGKVTMEPQDTFWGAHFGMLVDRFGVSWMFNCEHKK